jgi:L-iditol 2-dehydrogenase
LRIDSKSIFLSEPGKLELRKHSFEHSPSAGALLRMVVTTICGSDIRISKYGDPRITEPRILGHEMVAQVVDPGISKKFQSGDYVAIGADIPCGECRFCINGRSNLCEVHTAFGYQMNGGFSEFLFIPSKYLELAPIVRIAKSDYMNTFALAEPTGCALNGLRFSEVNVSDNLLIFGGGPVGIFLGLLANIEVGISNTKILIVEPSRDRRIFLNGLGLLCVESENEISGIKTFESGASKVFTATSAAITHQLALDHVSTGGAVNFFGGVPKGSPQLNIHANELHYRELTIGGSHGSRPEDHERAVEVIEENIEIWSKILSATYAIEDYRIAFEHVESATALKIGIEFDGV